MVPRHSGDVLLGCIGGRFVEVGGQRQIVLLDDLGNSYELDRCTILMGTWGGADEGVQKLPRVEVRDTSGAVVVAGDRVIILHVRGNPRRPVVLPGVRPLGAHDFLARLHASDADQNALRVRLQATDSAGTAGGRVDLEAGADEGGAVSVKVTDQLQVRAGADPDAATASVLTVGSAGVEIASGGNAVASLLGLTFLQSLQTWNTGITTFLTALAADATNPAVQAAATAMAAVHTPFAAQVSAAVTSGGAPLLSATLSTD